MSMKRYLTLLVLPLLLALAAGPSTGARDDRDKVLGRWDLTVGEGDQAQPSWLEITADGPEALAGRFCAAFGSASPLSEVTYTDGVLRFALRGRFQEGRSQSFQAKPKGRKLSGITWANRGQEIPWTGKRPPRWRIPKTVRWGKPIPLLNGQDLTGWHLRNPNGKKSWAMQDGLLVNQDPGNDLITDRQFKDFKIHAEFRLPKGSNSGLYLRGRYEMQIVDDYGNAPSSHGMGSIYGLIQPTSNPSTPAGDWQSVDVTLIGNVVTIVMNGETIVDRQEIPGVTGGALNSDEGEPGPIFIQGDHGRVEFRNLVITPRA